MKILHVETGRHFYGGAQQVVWLIKGLTARGIEAPLVCPPDTGIDAVARQQGIVVKNIDCGGDLDLTFAWRLRQAISDLKPDLVHCHSRRGADFLGGQAAAMAGVPAVVSRRVDNTESKFIAGLRYRPFKKVIAISEHIASMLKSGGLDPTKLSVIRSAVDVDSISDTGDCDAFRQAFDLDEKDFVLATVAQLIPRKGHRFLLDVLPNLRHQYPNLKVIFFGAGPLETELRALAAQLKLGATVQFAGFRDDLDHYLACIDLLVHPATQEGLGVAILKASAAGIPVIAFDHAGSREAIVHAKTGILVEPDDVSTLGKTIELMIDEPDMRCELGQAGRQHMRDEFSVNAMVASHVELYESVLHGVDND